MYTSATHIKTAQIHRSHSGNSAFGVRSFSGTPTLDSQQAAPFWLSAAYLLRVVGLALPYVSTFFAVLGGDLHCTWTHLLFHPVSQVILGYTLIQVGAIVCFYFQRGGAFIRLANGLGIVLSVALVPLWAHFLISEVMTPDRVWVLVIIPLEFVACIGFYRYATRRIG